jgi:uncharacterized protein YcbK (DUF882 family)
MESMSRWRYFAADEFACKHCGHNQIDADFVTRLDNLRHEYGKPMVISSGYRCPEHNAAVSSTGRDGPHVSGKAADIAVSGADARRLLGLAIALGFSGIGVQQKGSGRFLHLDDLDDSSNRPRPWLWSY